MYKIKNSLCTRYKKNLKLKTKLFLLATNLKIPAIAIISHNIGKVQFSYFVYKNRYTGRNSLIVGKFYHKNGPRYLTEWLP